MRSLSRPGVATTTSAPPRSAPACRPIDIPPTTVASRSFSDAGVRGERVGDLLGQLAGRYEDQGQRLPGLGALPGGTGQQRQAEGEGLARAGAPAAQDVAAGEGVRQRRRLDRERHGHALRGERGQQLRGHVEVGERLDGGQRGGDRHRQRELALDARRAGGRSRRSGSDRRNGSGPASRSGCPPPLPEPAEPPLRVREERSFVRVRFMQNLPRCGTYQGIPAANEQHGESQERAE